MYRKSISSSTLFKISIILESIGGPAWTYFSAVCWFYGKYLYDQLNVPIGLVSSTWGGTPIECWSSPKALQNCGLNAKEEYVMLVVSMFIYKLKINCT